MVRSWNNAVCCMFYNHMFLPVHSLSPRVLFCGGVGTPSILWTLKRQYLTHGGPDILQTVFSKGFSLIKIVAFKFHFLRVHWPTIWWYWFRWRWLGAEQAACQYSILYQQWPSLLTHLCVTEKVILSFWQNINHWPPVVRLTSIQHWFK